MYGYVLVNRPELKVKEYEKYQSYYCGLCQSLEERHGLIGRMTLNYDMTFLVMLLTDLYDRPETHECKRCIAHPCSKHKRLKNEISDYCADMCVLLAYYKLMDDWNDDHKITRLSYAKLLKPKVRKVIERYPEKAKFIEKSMNAQEIAEAAADVPVDKVAKIFGEILGEVFCYKDDHWKEDLHRVGFFLGKYIYMLDAYLDIDDDIKTGNYNPFRAICRNDDFTDTVLSMLLSMMGECTESFERLPLVENVEILRNILYSGVWGKFERKENGSL